MAKNRAVREDHGMVIPSPQIGLVLEDAVKLSAEHDGVPVVITKDGRVFHGYVAEDADMETEQTWFNQNPETRGVLVICTVTAPRGTQFRGSR